MMMKNMLQNKMIVKAYMNTKRVLLFLLCVMGLSSSLPVCSQELTAEYMANPFVPIEGGSGGGEARDGSVSEYIHTHPLLQNPVPSYILMGVIVSANWAVAMVRDLSGQEFFVRTGDKLGNNEGVISAIFSSGLEVEQEGEIFILNVKNRSTSFEKE
jgi:Tfp pilus assembly protein PilP